mgnify:CR=1 FL=1
MMRYFILLQIVIVLAACQSCTSYKTSNDIDFESILTESTSDSVEFSLSELLSPAGQKFMIIPPYTYLDRLSDSMGIDFMKLSGTGIEMRDDACVLALIQDGILVDYYLLSFQQIKLIGFQDIIQYDIKKPLYLKKRGGIYIIEL